MPGTSSDTALIWALVVVGVFVAVVVVAKVLQAERSRHLIATGMRTRGRVTKVTFTPGYIDPGGMRDGDYEPDYKYRGSYEVEYKYRDDRGQSHIGVITFREDSFPGLSHGDVGTVYYDPQRPSESTLTATKSAGSRRSRRSRSEEDGR